MIINTGRTTDRRKQTFVSIQRLKGTLIPLNKIKYIIQIPSKHRFHFCNVECIVTPICGRYKNLCAKYKYAPSPLCKLADARTSHYAITTPILSQALVRKKMFIFLFSDYPPSALRGFCSAITFLIIYPFNFI